MTPGARVAAAIECLDQILSGAPAEKVLTSWARASRFAGSGDRRAVRTHVFTALRQRRSAAWLGGAETGRALMIGSLLQQGADLSSLFNGVGHAPPPLTSDEATTRSLEGPPDPVRLDWPDWLWERAEKSLGDQTQAVLERLRHRANVYLRANLGKTTVTDAVQRLASDGIETEAHPLSPTALKVTSGETKLRASSAYNDGLVELQDAASQAVIDRLAAHTNPTSVLDACAGGGGKSLGLAARFRDARIVAHDANPARMNDLPARAARAGARIEVLTDPEGTFDLVLCDVPCSGSGAWSRSPEGKWRLDAAMLDDLLATQAGILDRFSAHVAPTGTLAYVTCSLLDDENSEQIQRFVERAPEWRLADEARWLPTQGGDGFYLAILTR